MDSSDDRTASLMTPAKLAQVVGAPRAPASPTAFLDRMAADVGHQQVRRLAELLADLQAGAQLAQAASALPAVHRLAEDLAVLDFAPLKAGGWWAGLTGKSRSAGAVFADLVDGADEAAQTLAGAAGTVHRQLQGQAIAVDRALVEFEVEYRALDTLMDQGTRWLHDMRAQLKARGADITGDPQVRRQLAQDESRCDLLVERLKALRAVAAAARQAHEEARATAGRRAALMKSVQSTVASQLQAWRTRVGKLAAAVAGGKAGAIAIDETQEAHGQLLQRLHGLLAEGSALRVQETTLAQAFDAVRAQLDAAAC